MSLLDTFTILFQSDTRRLDGGLDDIDKSVNEIEESANQADRSIAEMGKTFLAMAGTFLAVNAGIGKFNETVDELNALGATAEALRMPVEEVDAFGKAAQLLGGDAQGARDSLTDMAESIGEALQDIESGRAKTFAALGVDLRDINGDAITASEGILRLAESVEDMSREEAIFRIKELGITDNRTVEMVLKGRKELERMLAVQKEQGVANAEAVENARKYREAMSSLNNSVGSLGQQFMTALIPALITAVDWIKSGVDWYKENETVVVAFFAAVAGIITTLYLPAMISAAAATLAATWPIIAIGAAIAAVAAAFALVYDDIQNFIAGNDSLIGRIFEQYPMVEDIVYALGDAFKFVGNYIESVFNNIYAIGKAMFDFINNGIGKLTSAASSVAGFFGFGGGDIDMAQSAISQANSSPLNSVTSGAISNSVASTNSEQYVTTGDIVIQTQATDATGISRDIGNSLQDQIARLDTEFSTGVDR